MNEKETILTAFRFSEHIQCKSLVVQSQYNVYDFCGLCEMSGQVLYYAIIYSCFSALGFVVQQLKPLVNPPPIQVLAIVEHIFRNK